MWRRSNVLIPVVDRVGNILGASNLVGSAAGRSTGRRPVIVNFDYETSYDRLVLAFHTNK
jgi:hypothetical protein